ncbi:MAG: DNA replication/repair protein RecF [Anaerolineales bacterium]
MHISHLSLTNFRNYRRFESELPAGSLILVGRNAQGKTSLLEAVYYLAGAHSPHAGSDRQLINWLAVRTDPHPFLKIVAEVQTADELRKVDIRLELDEVGPARDLRLRKSIYVNGVKKRVVDLSGVVNAVLFLPQDMALVEGPPSARRRYLDATICQVDPVYCLALSEYGKILPQRNALLKSFQERNGNGNLSAGDESQLRFWDEQLCRHGAILIGRRARAIEEIELHATPVHRDLTQTAEHLRLAYQPAYDPVAPQGEQLVLGLDVPVTRARLSEEEIGAGMQARLRELRADEVARGATLIGPHRDELRFVASGVDLGVYGSRGQGRTAVLALKLAELAWMRDRSGEWPILLLDEVLAELDAHRRRDLLHRIDGVEQVLLSTANLDLFSASFRRQTRVWEVNGGTIRPMTNDQ